MLKLTDAATLKPCYVFGEVTGVQPMLASTAGIVPSRMVATTRVWYGCACVDVRETVDEVIGLLAAERSRAMESSHGRSGITHVCAGDDPASPTDDVMVPAWLHNRMTGMAAAITAILDMANDCKPGEASAWSLDDPDAVVRMVRERMVRRDPCTSCATHTCLHDNGCAHGCQANDVPAATEGTPISTKPAALTFDDAIRLSKGCFDYGGGYRCDVDKLSIYHHGISTVTNVLEAAKKARVDGVVDRQVEMVSAVGASVEDGEMAAALDAMMDAHPTHAEHAAMLLNAQNTRCCQPEAALEELSRPNGAHTKTDDEPGVDRPGCYTTDPVSASGCSKPISLGCDGCVANPLQNPTDALRVPADLLTGEYNANTARASMLMRDPATGITVAADLSVQPDQVVLRSHTVDGKLLDEVRVVNVGTDPSGTDPFAGAADDEIAALSPRASVVITSLGTKAREVVRFLADRDPQTALRILGAVFGGDDLDGQAGAESRVPMDQLKNLELVQRVDRLPHDEGKPLMDRWTLTTLGREVARFLARG